MRLKLLFPLLLVFNFTFSQTSTSSAEFPGGNKAFVKEFLRMVDSYVDVSLYAVDGKFTITIHIDDKGNMSELKVFPIVRNYEDFQQDLGFAMNKIKKKWKPATQSGQPISSNYAFQIDFTTDYADHGD